MLASTLLSLAARTDLLADFAPAPAEIRQESRGAVTVRRAEAGRKSLEIVQAQTIVHSPIETVWAVITDYPDYPQLFPRISRSQVRTVGGQEEHYTEVNYPWPYRSRWVLDSIHENRSRWVLRWHRLEGTIRELEGEWELEPDGPATILRYAVRIDPGLPFVPQWLISWGTQTMAPSILLAVAHEAELRAMTRAARAAGSPSRVVPASANQSAGSE
ncbi:MAG: SRPBCC family protein [Cyanobacteria bacterium REEB65]|nr:SRPBCC family protein [Cyanobacteria bacterium REEB65]